MELFPIRANTKRSANPGVHHTKFINKRQKIFKVTIHTTKSRFTINCGWTFTLFVNNFNIKRGEFVLSFCLHRKGHIDLTRKYFNWSFDLKRTKISSTFLFSSDRMITWSIFMNSWILVTSTCPFLCKLGLNYNKQLKVFQIVAN